MKIKTVLIILQIFIINVSFSQISFIQNNEIVVLEDGDTLLNPWAGGMNFCQFSKIDMNLDGEKDLFIFDKSGRNGTSNGNKIIPFLLNPLTNAFEYAPQYIPLFPELENWTLLLDYNGDLKADIFTSYNSSIAVYTNTSSTELDFEFNKVLTSDAGFGPTNVYVSNSDIPAIVDVDNDSDIDILTFDPSGTHIYFHENKSIQMYGNADSINLVRSNDCWGRFKEDFSTNSVTLNLDEDCNEEEEQRISHSGSTILALDINPSKNQSLELLLGDITYDNMVMLHNGGSTEEALMIDQDLNFPSYNNSINLTRFPGAFYLDVDHDNQKDIIISPNGVNVSENHKNSLFYKNTGTNSENNTIEFEFIENDFIIKEMIDVGSNGTPLLYDLNDDSLLDLIISNKGYFDNGNYQSSISIYKNIGTSSNPIFDFITNDFSNLSSSLGASANIQSLHPTFGDINNDGNIDMIIGDNNGELYYFENDGSTLSEFPFFSNYEMLNIDVGSFATPQLIDLNRDGLIDLIIGERMGIDNGVYNGINYYQNIGSITNPSFENYTPEFLSGEYNDDGDEIIIKSLGGIHLGDPTYLTAYTQPFIFEYNNTYHLAIGTEEGLIYLYENIETLIDNNYNLNLGTEFNLITNNIVTINNCIHSKITISDINNDQLPDLIRGNASGGVELFLGGDLNTENSIESNQDFQIIPNPNNGLFVIKAPQNINYTTTIYSNLGRTVLKKYHCNNKTTINLSNQKTGIYIARIQSSNQLFIEKIIINH